MLFALLYYINCFHHQQSRFVSSFTESLLLMLEHSSYFQEVAMCSTKRICKTLFAFHNCIKLTSRQIQYAHFSSWKSYFFSVRSITCFFFFLYIKKHFDDRLFDNSFSTRRCTNDALYALFSSVLNNNKQFYYFYVIVYSRFSINMKQQIECLFERVSVFCIDFNYYLSF